MKRNWHSKLNKYSVSFNAKTFCKLKKIASFIIADHYAYHIYRKLVTSEIVAVEMSKLTETDLQPG